MIVHVLTVTYLDNITLNKLTEVVAIFSKNDKTVINHQEYLATIDLEEKGHSEIYFSLKSLELDTLYYT